VVYQSASESVKHGRRIRLMSELHFSSAIIFSRKRADESFCDCKKLLGADGIRQLFIKLNGALERR
jgi:hypothetical protein